MCKSTEDHYELISPCSCTGAHRYVHRRCLDKRQCLNKYGAGFSDCDHCGSQYIFEPVLDDLAVRDIILIILLIVGILTGATFLFQLADKSTHTIKDLYPGEMNPMLVYALCSLQLFSVIITMIGLICAAAGWGLRGELDQSSSAYDCLSSLYRALKCCGCSGGCNGGDLQGIGICACCCLLLFLSFLLIYVLLFGFLTGVTVLIVRIQLRIQRLWLRQETEKYVFKDLAAYQS